MLFARVDILCYVAPLAFDIAAPDDLTVAGFLYNSSVHIVSPAAAEYVTVVLFVTHAVPCAGRVLTAATVVRRALQVHKVALLRTMLSRVFTAFDQLTFTRGLIGRYDNLDPRVIFDL